MHTQRALWVVALFGSFYLTSESFANPGPAPPWEAIAEYNRVTGQVFVSYTDLQPVLNAETFWRLESKSSAFIGDEPMSLSEPDGINPLMLNSDDEIAVAYLLVASTPWTAVDLDLGRLAAPGFPDDDISLFFSGEFVRMGTVQIVPELSAVLLTSLAVLLVAEKSLLVDRSVQS